MSIDQAKSQVLQVILWLPLGEVHEHQRLLFIAQAPVEMYPTRSKERCGRHRMRQKANSNAGKL
jgi:hypothetical protein